MEQNRAYLDLTILSAADLKRKWLSGDQMVAVAWVDPSRKETTSVVSCSGSNVQWHEKLILNLNGPDTLLQGKLLTIEIHARGTWGNSLLGSVYVPLVELPLDGEKPGNTTLMYQIVQPSGKRQGSMKFFAKVVKPSVSGSTVSLSGSVAPLPSAPPMTPQDICPGSNALYPPVSAMCPSVGTYEETTSSVVYPTFKVSPYTLKPHLSQNNHADHAAWQHDTSPYPSYGMSCHPPHSPINTTYPLHTSPSPCSPHANYTGTIQYPPLSPQFSGTPYPSSAFVYPPPTLFSGAPYTPIAPHTSAPYPPIAPHSSVTYPPDSLYPYSSPLYPPPYTQQRNAAVH